MGRKTEREDAGESERVIVSWEVEKRQSSPF